MTVSRLGLGRTFIKAECVENQISLHVGCIRHLKHKVDEYTTAGQRPACTIRGANQLAGLRRVGDNLPIGAQCVDHRRAYKLGNIGGKAEAKVIGENARPAHPAR